MKNPRSATARFQKRSSSIISRIRAHQRGISASDSTDSLKSVGGPGTATEHNMLSTPYSLSMPALLT